MHSLILACPPQPTEDSSSTDANDAPNDNNNNDPFALATATNSILSDSDDRQSYAFKLRQKPVGGNFESDSLNENFSPSRPHLRRKRKFKRMAVEYETTPSTPQTGGGGGVVVNSHTPSHPIFPLNIIAKKRVIKPSQEFRSNLFFGKRKRPHRERLYDYESFRHSSSVPRQRNGFPYQKECSYLEYKSRNRASSMSMQRSVNSALEKIMPLNKSIVSKIEKISKENQSRMNSFTFTPQPADSTSILNFNFGSTASSTTTMTTAMSQIPYCGGAMTMTTLAQMPNTLNFETANGMRFASSTMMQPSLCESALMMKTNGLLSNGCKSENKRKIKNSLVNNAAAPHQHHRKHHKHSRRFQLQFDDQNFMEYEQAMNDSFLSSSSLSSSESETEDTNGSDHEGDDELTDWPGHESMVNFGKVADLKSMRKSSKLKKIKQDEVLQDDETLMSADEVQFPIMKTPNASPVMMVANNDLVLAAKLHSSHPIDINLIEQSHLFSQQDGSSTSGIADYGSYNLPSNFPRVIESEMSGETSNSLLSSSMANEIREIRAGCRRIRDERPGFSILASFNDELMR